MRSSSKLPAALLSVLLTVACSANSGDGGGDDTGTTTGGTTVGTTTAGGATTAGSATSWWKPTPSNTWVWDLDKAQVSSPTVTRAPNVTNYSPDVYDVDPQNVQASGIATLHNNGKKVVCYIDVGSWDKRNDRANFDSNCICGPGVTMASNGNCPTTAHQMEGWTEWWFNIHDPDCVASTLSGMTKRFQAAHDAGCDAIEPDNLDAFANSDVATDPNLGAGWEITIADQNAYVTSLASIAHGLGMGILLKNANGLLQDSTYAASIVSAFDGSLNEQCHQYTECDTYAAFGAAGKSMWNAEYGSGGCSGTSYKSAYCGTTGMKTLQYACTSVEVDNLSYVCP